MSPELKKAKEKLKKLLGKPEWLAGVGIGLSCGFVLQVNINEDTTEIRDMIPKVVDNIPVHIQFVGKIVARKQV